MNIRQQVMFATGRAAAQSGWSESRLVDYIRKRGATSSEVEHAKESFQDFKQAPATGADLLAPGGRP